MKELGFEIHQIVGVADGKHWSQVRVFLPVDDQEISTGGGLILVMNLLDGGERQGNEWLEEAVERFQTSEEGRKEWLHKEVTFFEDKIGGQGEILLVVVKKEGEETRLHIYGDGEEMMVGIRRDRRKGRLWPLQDLRPIDGGGVVTGKLINGDELIVGTKRFVEEIWEQLRGGGVEERTDQARLMTINSPLSGDLAGAVVVVKEVDKFSKDHRREELVEQEVEVEDRTTKERERREKWRGFVEKLRVGGRLPKIGAGRWRGGILFIVVLALIVSIGLGWWQKQLKAYTQSYKMVADPIEQAIVEARELRDLNFQRSRGLVLQARDDWQKRGDEFTNGRFADQWKRLGEEIETVWKEVSGEKKVVGETWFDLGVVRDGTEIMEMTKVGKKLVVLDEKAGVVVEVAIEDKSVRVVGGGDFVSTGRRLGGGEGRLVVLTESGVTSAEMKKWQFERVLSEGEDWRSKVDVDAYGSNVYVLDREDLWKYAGDIDGLGVKRRYFGVGVEPDLGQAVDLEIDGEVWILLNSGKILRFDRGVSVAYEMKGVNDFGSVDEMVVGEKEIYVLDKGKGRVVRIERETGEYKGELLWEGFKEGRGLVVDEEGGRVLVGNEGKIMEVRW